MVQERNVKRAVIEPSNRQNDSEKRYRGNAWRNILHRAFISSPGRFIGQDVTDI
jgi:hypothetical protein